jgi:hypothetical protein
MEQFWKPEPREPWHDWRTYSMLGPIAAGALGACIFFALGLAFAEIVNIRAEVRKPLIFVASFGVATLLGGTTNWSQQAVIWGSAAVCGFAALDAAGDMIELGGLFGSYEERVEQWRAEREAWRVSTGQSVTANGQEIVTKLSQLETAISQLNHRWAWPTATAADVNRATAHLNGDRANLTREELGVILAEHQLNLPSPSTVKRGLG